VGLSRFANRATSGQKHNLEQEIYKEAIKALAEDIDMIIEKADKKVFLSVPKTISNDLLSHLKNKDKIFRIVEKDLIKEKDTNRLIEEFKPQF